MTHDQDNSPFAGMELSDAAMIRIAADGEQDLLSTEQRSRLDQLLASPENVARVEAEHSLRDAIARTHTNTALPDGIEQRLRARLALTENATPESGSEEAGPERLAPQTRSHSFWRRAAATLAVAAALVLGVVSIFNTGTPSTPGLPQNAGLTPQIVSARSSAAHHVSNEHHNCVMSAERALAKGSVVAPEDLPVSVEQIMGKSVDLDDLIFSDLSNVTFDWAGPCSVPGPPSMHLSFDGPHGQQISLFIQRAHDKLALDPEVTYTAGSACGDEGPAVYIWTRHGLVYYLVSDQTPGCDSLLKDRSAPETTHRFLDQA